MPSVGNKIPFVFPLAGGGGEHLPLLTTANAHRMRAGMVTVAPGASCGRHSTEGYEELLIILEGEGEVELEGHGRLTLTAPCVAYIPPQTPHDVFNTGSAPLKYIYVVAPVL